MIARIIVPECSGYYEGYCIDNWHSTRALERIKALEKAMDDKFVGLVVTSNNYFEVMSPQSARAQTIINRMIIKDKLNNIPAKLRKPLAIGFDIFGDIGDIGDNGRTKISKKTKGNKSGNKKLANRYSGINPYGGIDAIVCFLTINQNNEFELGAYIWESWYGRGGCDEAGFVEQNSMRQITFRGTKFVLLSCGDLFSYCHEGTKNLPSANVYLNLAHTAYSGRGMRSLNKLSKSRKKSKVIVSFQTNSVGKYLTSGYPWVSPLKNRRSTKIIVEGDSRFLLVDYLV